MKARPFAAALAAQFVLVGASFGQSPPQQATEPAAALLALVNLPAKGAATLTVRSPAFQPGTDIPFENTQYRGNVFPGLSWSARPAGTKASVVIMQDGQAYMGPRTPAGPKHRYHFQIFALDTTPPADALASYDALTGAMKDHVLASGETIGLGQAAPPSGGG